LGKKHGIKKILLLPPPYQKNVHCKQKLSVKENKNLSSDIAIIATWFPERGIFFKKLIDYGLKIKIYGNRWDKDPNYSLIKSYIKLGHIDHPLYSKIIQSAKISICYPSKGNLDGTTRRSIEIPAIGSLLFAKRTAEHKKLFLENKEAIFFSSAKECYNKCIYFLNNESKRKKIAMNGNKKVTKILKADYFSSMKTFMEKVNQFN
jgi:spore maturation protein CgeB